MSVRQVKWKWGRGIAPIFTEAEQACMDSVVSGLSSEVPPFGETWLPEDSATLLTEDDYESHGIYPPTLEELQEEAINSGESISGSDENCNYPWWALSFIEGRNWNGYDYITLAGGSFTGGFRKISYIDVIVKYFAYIPGWRYYYLGRDYDYSYNWGWATAARIYAYDEAWYACWWDKTDHLFKQAGCGPNNQGYWRIIKYSDVICQ